MTHYVHVIRNLFDSIEHCSTMDREEAKRRMTDDDERDMKRPRLENNCFIRLASESSTDETDNTESVYSIQDQETVIAKDTSDTDWSDFGSRSDLLEYELTEVDRDNPLKHEQLSSGETEVEDIAQLGAVVAAVLYDSEIDLGLYADASTECSTSPSSFSDPDPELPRQDYCDFSCCAMCKMPNSDSNYRYCSKCYHARKTFFPPRPRHKAKKIKRKKLVSNSSTCSKLLKKKFMLAQSSLESGADEVDSIKNINFSQGSSGIYSLEEQSESEKVIVEGDVVDFPKPSTSYESSFIVKRCKSASKCQMESTKVPVANSDTIVKDDCICPICFSKPKNGLFIHGKTAHLYCCYNCALKAWASSGCCSLCRKKVKQVIKLDQGL